MVANSHYLKLEYSTSKKSRQIKGEDNEDAAAESGYVIPRLLSRYPIAVSMRRISFKHHPFLRGDELIIKWKIHGIIRLIPAGSLRWADIWFNFNESFSGSRWENIQNEPAFD